MSIRSYLSICLYAVSAALASCGSRYCIDGSADLYGYDGKQLSAVVYDGSRFVSVDSCEVRHGRFSMEGLIDSVRFAVLCCDSRPVLPLFLEKGNITVKMSASGLDVSGTRQNNLLYEFLARKKELDNRFEDMFQQRENIAASRFEADVKKMVQEAEDYFYNFISSHYEEPVGLSVFVMMCDAQPRDGQMTPLIKRILDSAPESFLKKKFVRNYISRCGYPSVD